MNNPRATEDLSAMLQQHLPQGQSEVQARDFLARVQREIDEQVDQRVQQMMLSAPTASTPVVAPRRGVSGEEVGLILGSLLFAIPLTAIAAAGAGFVGILAVWIGLVLIHAAWATRSR